MAFRMTLQIAVTDPEVDARIERIAEALGGRSHGWTKGRVVSEASKLMETNIEQFFPRPMAYKAIMPKAEPGQVAENDIQ